MVQFLDTQQAGGSGYLVGLDIGGTKTAVVVADLQESIVAEGVVATRVDSPEAFLDSVIEGIDRTLTGAGIPAGAMLAVGAGIPGQVDPIRGTVQYAVNLNLVEFPLGAMLSARYQAPVVLENDVRLAAAGVYDMLRRREALQHLAYVSIGTGIAAGLVLNGRLYRGAGGMAGEIGHMLVEPGGALCACGAHGCLETIVSGPAIARQAAPALQAADYHPPFTAEQVFHAATRGSTAVQQVLQRVGHYLAQTIQWIVLTYDVEKVVLGGGVTSAGAAFMDPVLSELSRLRASSPLANVMLAPDKVLSWSSKTNAGTWGAILLAREALAN